MRRDLMLEASALILRFCGGFALELVALLEHGCYGCRHVFRGDRIRVEDDIVVDGIRAVPAVDRVKESLAFPVRPLDYIARGFFVDAVTLRHSCDSFFQRSRTRRTRRTNGMSWSR